MDTLHHYSSSSSDEDDQADLNDSAQYEDLSGTSKSSRLPPPEALEATDLQLSRRKRRKTQNILLPPVSPAHEKVNQYLVHVFLPLNHPDLSSFARNLLGQARLRMVGKPLKASLTPLTDFHISISRPVVIRSEQIHPLVRQIRKAVSQYPEGRITIKQKPVAFLSKNQRRLFVAAPVVTTARDDEEFVFSLIGITSKIFKNNGLIPFFDDPRPHVSFAWTAMDISPLFAAVASDDNDQRHLTISVKTVSCTIGKSKYVFPLSQGQS